MTTDVYNGFICYYSAVNTYKYNLVQKEYPSKKKIIGQKTRRLLLMGNYDIPETFKSVPRPKIFDMVKQHAETLNSLRRLGLNQYEAQAYLALCLTKSGTAGELAENAELPRPRVYDVLEKLQEKGFVALKPGRPVQYAPIGLDEALKTVKRQKETTLASEIAEIEQVGSALSTKLKTTPTTAVNKFDADTNIWTLRGREAIYSKLASMVTGANDRVIVSSNPAGLALKLKMHKKEFESAKKRGVKVSFVSPVSENAEMTGEMARLGGKLFSKQMPTRMVLADDQAMVFLTSESVSPEEEIGLWVKSQHLAQTLEQALNLQGLK